MHPTRRTACHALGPLARDLAQLLVNTEVVHHDSTVQDLQQGVLGEGLLRLLGGPPQQQALVPVAALNCEGKGRVRVGATPVVS